MAAIFADSATPFQGVSMIATSTACCSKNGRKSRRPNRHSHEATGIVVRERM